MKTKTTNGITRAMNVIVLVLVTMGPIITVLGVSTVLLKNLHASPDTATLVLLTEMFWVFNYLFWLQRRGGKRRMTFTDSLFFVVMAEIAWVFGTPSNRHGRNLRFYCFFGLFMGLVSGCFGSLILEALEQRIIPKQSEDSAPNADP